MSARQQVFRGVSTLRKLGPRQVAEAYLVGTLWWYSASVLYPARLLRWGGVGLMGGPRGEEPVGLPRPGLGRGFAAASTATLVVLLVASIMHMAARAYNPFIYFRF